MTIARRLTLALLLGVFAFSAAGCKLRARHFVRHATNKRIIQDAQERNRNREAWRKQLKHPVSNRTANRLRTR